MKKNRIIYLAVAFALAAVMAFGLSGCGEDKAATDETEPTTTEATTEATTTTTKAKDDSILKSKLQAMIDQYGRGTSSGSGVTYAKAMDLDGDGENELVVIHDMKLEIIAVKDKAAESVFEGTVGIQYGQTDTSYEVMINESISPTTIVLFNSSDEWVDENITAVSMSGGAVTEKSLKASTNGENDTPAREELVNFSIDGTSVSASEYSNEYTRLTEGADSVNPMSPADLDAVLAAL